jgi:hypothetical protein
MVGKGFSRNGRGRALVYIHVFWFFRAGPVSPGGAGDCLRRR